MASVLLSRFNFSRANFPRANYSLFDAKTFLLGENLARLAHFSHQAVHISDSNRNLPSFFFRRDEVTIAVVDSGLGGLSIMAEAASRLEQARIFRQVDLIFFNALFSREGGYNTLPTREAKIQMFDRVLAALEKRFRPDLILLACNTLSTLYPATAYALRMKTPVLDIIEPGVELIARHLQKEPSSAVVIFGTPTTISEDTHRQKLLALGFAPGRIFVQSCPELELFIEKSPEGEETGMLIEGFVAEALQKIPAPRPPLIISLNCTHYGYSLPLWEKALTESQVKVLALLNPNSSLADRLIGSEREPRFRQTRVRARCFSKVPIESEKREAISSWLRQLSPTTAEALLHYSLNPNLF